MSGVDYVFNLGSGATISGMWNFGGVHGRFTFFVAGNSTTPIFSGSWQANGQSGNWHGEFAGIV